MRTHVITSLALAAVIGVVGAACSSSSNSSSGSSSSPSSPAASASASGGSEGSITIAGQTITNHGSKDVSGANTVELEADNDGSNYYFDPTVLSGKPGQTLKITVKNTGDTPHNFSIDSQHINTNISPGQTATVTIKFPTSGDVEFYCAFHKSLGMIGELSAS